MNLVPAKDVKKDPPQAGSAAAVTPPTQHFGSNDVDTDPYATKPKPPENK